MTNECPDCRWARQHMTLERIRRCPACVRDMLGIPFIQDVLSARVVRWVGARTRGVRLPLRERYKHNLYVQQVRKQLRVSLLEKAGTARHQVDDIYCGHWTHSGWPCLWQAPDEAEFGPCPGPDEFWHLGSEHIRELAA